MSWVEHLRASFSGDVGAVDVTALLAAVGPLEALRHQLDDRRLSARISHVGEEWRTLADVAALALPLWLGDSLVMLAQSLREVESDAHPGRPDTLSPASHDLCVAALQPIDRIVAEASAAAADPGHQSSLTTTVIAGPGGEVAARPVPSFPPSGYLQGLLLAADRIHGAAGALATDVAPLLQTSSPPPALTTAVQHVKGDLAGAGARLDLLRARVNALPTEARHLPTTADAAAALCADLWRVLNIAFVSGQRLSDPRLLPGYTIPAPPRPAPIVTPIPNRPSSFTNPPQTSPPKPPMPLTPRPRERPTVVEALPEIETLPSSTREHRLLTNAERTTIRQGTPEPAELPEIGGPGIRQSTAVKRATPPLPHIDRGAARNGPDDEAVAELPEIGET